MSTDDLNADIAAIEQRMAELETHLAQSRRTLRDLVAQRTAETEDSSRIAPPTPIVDDATGDLQPRRQVNRNSPPADKIALFRALFAGRTDVYASRWTSSKTGKSGWSPVVRGGFYTDAVSNRDLLPVSDEVIAKHLMGSHSGGDGLHAGLYPMLDNDTCRLLVCDFDDGSWKADAAAYAAACSRHGVIPAVEISRSGDGAHVWFFFAEPITAQLARSLGLGLLRDAMARQKGMSLSSYDRLFPSQDLLPIRSPGRMRLGNLIALPLQGACRRRGTTVFVDAETWVAFGDQFAFLSGIVPLSTNEIETAASTLRPVRTGPVASQSVLQQRPATGDPSIDRGERKVIDAMPSTVAITLSSVISIPTIGLPSGLTADLKHAASLANPEFYRRQAQRFSTFGTPRFVYCFEHDETTLRLPRGLLDSVKRIMKSAGIKIELSSELPAAQPINLAFRGELTPAQIEAVGVMKQHDTGVLVAPPGSGKTVIACALIADLAVPTAIIVNRAELVEQWRDRLTEFLEIDATKIGQLGGGRRKRTQIVDIVMLQSIAHRAADPTVLNGYGLIVVDECHALGAAATEAAVRQIAVRRWIGLTATPYRADQMDDIITMQCGPIRHTIDDSEPFAKELIVHETAFEAAKSSSDEIQAIYTELASDVDRNQLIAGDVLSAYGKGRNSLVLSTRVEHVEQLAELLRSAAATVFVLHGKLPTKDRRRIRAELDARSPADPFVLVAIDRIAGEGFDLPSLDTLFLAVPMAFKGRIVQQIGRISRASRTTGVTGEPSASQVHDYWDAQVPVFDRMFRKRQRVLSKLGFAVAARQR
ncbi:DEAD/DEAH box helicase [Cryobacterium sp. Y11]|uniref:DEAD/DEAH box helicase n=1 Tax=Cryobacterium sp. Y11 TaxID=2045016 RepID=UPI001304DB8B|nr:DEAD/DEAH box helicase [Cryobacterium sp. Y11]